MTDTYNMSNDLQTSTLGAMIIVVAVMVWGICALASIAKAGWSIEDVESDVDHMAKDLFIGRDLHTDVRDRMREVREG